MKRSLLMLGLGMFSMTLAAQTSPFQGTELTEAGGDFYLYNVNTGRWLQNNDDNSDDGTSENWTTRAEMGTRGFSVTISVLNNQGDGDYRINPHFGRNKSINIGNLYMDTDEGVTSYYIDAVEGTDIPNAYTITALSGGSYIQLGVNENGWLTRSEADGEAENNIWQLVTKEERLKYLAENATSTNPVDATWLIDGATFAAADERNNSWVTSTSKSYETGGTGNAISGDGTYHYNRVKEFYNFEKVSMVQTLKGLPNGTYELSVQGYYRDGASETRKDWKDPYEYVVNRRENGTEKSEAYYFANSASHTFMSILDEAQEKSGKGFNYNAQKLDSEGNIVGSGHFVPNTTSEASVSIFEGYYKNPSIKTTVADGTLQLGVKKDEGATPDNWIIIDNFKLTYLGSDVDVDEVKQDLTNAIADGKTGEGQSTEALNKILSDAIAAGEATLASSSDATTIAAAATAIKTALANVTATASNAQALLATIPLAQEDGVNTDSIAKCQNVAVNSVSADEISSYLSMLRLQRRLTNAEKAENVFTGNAPAAGEFYLYNVGTKRFFCGGGDWGAHAAVGFPGIQVTLVPNAEGTGYVIDTQLQNGNGQHYLNYGGYCDTSNQDPWTFNPVGNGVYTISRTNASDSEKESGNIYLGYRPNRYDVIDTDMGDPTSDGNKWILVTKDDRDVLLESASEENPVDASYYIKMPNFSQREYVITGGWDSGDNPAWTHTNGSIWGRNDNHDDFVFECYNQDPLALTQTVTDLFPGYYILSCQGYYRDGSRANHAAIIADGGEPQHLGWLSATATDDEIMDVQLPLVSDYKDKVPGYGYESSIGRFPDSCTDAQQYFQNGYYKVGGYIKVGDDGMLEISVTKDNGGFQNGDWVVVDNFRLTYLGESVPTAIKGVTENTDTVNDGKIYNLNGVQVKSATQRGIYIKNGKKYVVK